MFWYLSFSQNSNSALLCLYYSVVCQLALYVSISLLLRHVVVHEPNLQISDVIFFGQVGLGRTIDTERIVTRNTRLISTVKGLLHFKLRPNMFSSGKCKHLIICNSSWLFHVQWFVNITIVSSLYWVFCVDCL